ncbi:alkylation response protein AidB-like acyl-CoA dehydrogenase [Paraburkholderia sp. BL8N3]|jgi:alkylation response protein AidB-like acyl-CoA dehydrogenase|nr:acyl-CoA dehydrogenase [Paraburkholderia sp. BL8N3]TCK42276.1 alkylation response protein AidB-like acyl-CoA dehydrogenase [Paraburkholderia sp. BL8N3]
MAYVMSAPARACATELKAFLRELNIERGTPAAAAHALRTLIDAGLDRIDLPGKGATLERWRILGAVAAFDLSLVKLYEGHTDALAILAELECIETGSGEAWGVWAAEPPSARLAAMTTRADRRIRLRGTKAWCSGAAFLTHALVSAWNERDEPILAAVDLHQPSVCVTNEGWKAVGMSASASVDVHFDNAAAVQIGAPRAYLDRPGFWQGGAGIAACWFGAAAAIGNFVRQEAARRPDPYRLAHLGAIDTALASAASLMREAAAQIDREPKADAMVPALRARLAVERAATTVMEHAGRALGAAPLCRNEHFARLMADLPVFIRQSHAERDEAALAQRIVEEERGSWLL